MSALCLRQRSALSRLDRTQTCNDTRCALDTVLCLEAKHHCHVVSPHVHCITLSAYPFGDREDCTLRKSGHCNLTTAHSHLACRGGRNLDRLVSHIAYERGCSTNYTTHYETMLGGIE